MVCVLIASGLKAYAQNSYVQSTGVGGGTLYWTNNASGPQECGNDYTYYSYRYSTFSWVAAGVTYPLNGVDAYIATPNGVTGCPPSGPEPGPYVTMALPVTYGAGNCVINFYPGNDTGTATMSCPGFSYNGYVDPLYIVVGVTYAPPGPASFVQYTDSQTLALTTTHINTFTAGTTVTTTVSDSASIGGFKAGSSTSNAVTATIASKGTNSVALNWSTAEAIKTFGTAAPGTPSTNPLGFQPVDHDFDIVYVWLNPVELFNVSSKAGITWNGFGYDANDPNGLDVVGIALGYLNGDFGAMPPDLLAFTNRTWADGQSGPSPALTSANFTQIASFDPFSNNAYGTNEIGVAPPNPSTADNRFSLANCTLTVNGIVENNDNFEYVQAPPSQTPSIYTCTLTYSNLTTNTQAITVTASDTFTLDQSFTEGGSFYGFGLSFTQDLKVAGTLTYQFESDNSIAKTNATSSQISITGPACNNKVADEGPCVPVYDSGSNEPVEFFIYQDNLYGTFMFAPVDYY
jgi:hypothetical protein